MSFAPPTLARDYDLISSLDPALDAPERAGGEDETEWKERFDAWNDRLRIARENGDWSALLRDGMKPTLFRCRHVPGDKWAMRDRVLAGMGVDEYMGHVVRLAVVGVDNYRLDFKLKLVEHTDLDKKPTGFGKVADPALVAELAAIRDADGNPVGQHIVNELGALIIARQMGAPPGK